MSSAKQKMLIDRLLFTVKTGVELNADEVRLLLHMLKVDFVEPKDEDDGDSTFEPIPAKNYSVAQKIQFFDKLHAMALEHYEGSKSGVISSSQTLEENLYSAVMALLGEDAAFETEECWND